jgi:molybdopterin synthase catalytic subunit
VANFTVATPGYFSVMGIPVVSGRGLTPEDDGRAERVAVVSEALARWAGARVALGHRLGLVPVGEASIAIAVAAPHRAAAFEACRYVIEEVKQRVPIWKREIHADGTAVWVDAHGRPAEAPR